MLEPVPQPTPAPDLDTIRERFERSQRWYGGPHRGWELASDSSKDVPVLLAEVARLTAELEQVRYHERIRARVIADHQGRLIAADTAIAGLAAAEAKLALQQPVIDAAKACRDWLLRGQTDQVRVNFMTGKTTKLPGTTGFIAAEVYDLATALDLHDALSSQPANPGDTQPDVRVERTDNEVRIYQNSGANVVIPDRVWTRIEWRA